MVGSLSLGKEGDTFHAIYFKICLPNIRPCDEIWLITQPGFYGDG